jgi:hypothetical protein
MKHLFKVGKCTFRLFWIAGKLFVSKSFISNPVLRYELGFGIDDEIEAFMSFTSATYHTCAFALLLSKNLIFKLVHVGGELYTICANSAFSKLTEEERSQSLNESSVVDELKRSFILEETDDGWIVPVQKEYD